MHICFTTTQVHEKYTSELKTEAFSSATVLFTFDKYISQWEHELVQSVVIEYWYAGLVFPEKMQDAVEKIIQSLSLSLRGAPGRGRLSPL